MSGTMGQLPGPMPQPGMPQGAAPQINPAILQALMAAHGAAGAPGPMGTPPQMPTPAQPMAAPPTAPPGQPPAMPPTIPMAPPGSEPGGAPGGADAIGRNVSLLAQADGAMPVQGGRGGLAAHGRMGDTMVAHMTPGEIAVPPQVQTPALLAALAQAFKAAGVALPQFTAGSHAASVNPRTGKEEFSFWSGILPMLLGTVGSVVAPELLPASWGAFAPAIGGAIGGGAGSALSGGTGTADLLSALGGGLGGAAGSAFGGAGKATQQAAQQAADLGSLASFSPVSAASMLPTTSPFGSMGNFASALTSPTALGAGLGAGIGSSFMPTSVPSPTPAVPANFNDAMPPLNPNFGSLLGSNQAQVPNFTGYNPVASVSGQPFRFFPVG